MSTKKHNHFDVAHLHADMKGHTVRGGKTTIAAQGIGFFLNIASVMILARLLSPEDYGMIAMVTALTGIVTIFKDGSLSIVTIQREHISHEQVSTLFWINVAISFVLMLAIAALSPAIALFYGQPKLSEIALAIAAIFFLGGLAIQHQALLRRQMRFGALARIQIASAAFGLMAAIGAALAEAGYWALIVQMAVAEFTGLFLTWLYCRWLPGAPKRGVGTRAMLVPGGHLTVLGFFAYMGRNADNILIGSYLGSHALGLYSKAYSLLLLPIQQINGPIAAVAMPALSRLQAAPEEFRDFFRKILSIICFTSFLVIVWMMVCREEIVLIILGPKWLDAIPIYLALAISALCQPIGNVSGLLYITLGRTKRMLIWGILGNSWLVVGIVLGLPYGVLGVALGYSIASVLLMLPLIFFSITGTFVVVSDFLDAIKIPALAALISGITGEGINHFLFSDFPYWIKLIVLSLLVTIIYLGVVFLTRPQLLFNVLEIALKRKIKYA